MKYAPLIWAALWRRPVEALLTWLAVTAAFTLFAAMIGVNVSYQQAINSSRADRMYVSARFPASMGGLPIGLQDRLEKFSGVSAVGAFATLCGYRGEQSSRGCVYHINEGMQHAWSELPVKPSEWQMLFARLDGVLVSQKVAGRLNLKVGDVLTITIPAGVRADGAKGWSYQVLEIIPDDPSWSNGYMLGNLAYFTNARPLEAQGMIGGFRLALSDAAHANEVARSIDRHFANSGTPTLSVSARADAENSARSSVDVASMTRLIAASGLLMILFLTANGIARSVKERIREFAVFQALGYSSHHLMALVFVEVAIPCLLGAAFGTAVATVLTASQTRFLRSELIDIPKVTVNPEVWMWALGFGIVLALVSSAIPLMKLRRLDPAASLASQ